MARVGNEQVDIIVIQGPEVIRARLDVFMQFELTLIRQVNDHLASAMSAQYVYIPKEDLKARRVRAFRSSFGI